MEREREKMNRFSINSSPSPGGISRDFLLSTQLKFEKKEKKELGIQLKVVCAKRGMEKEEKGDKTEEKGRKTQHDQSQNGDEVGEQRNEGKWNNQRSKERMA